MNFYFDNHIVRNKYIMVSDGIEPYIIFGVGTNRKTIKDILKKNAPA